MAEKEGEEKEVKKHMIERAKTARSSCKDCGGVIAKGDFRFGFVDFAFSDHGSYKYYHLTCGARRRPREFAEARARAKAGELEVSEEEIDAGLQQAPGTPVKAAAPASSSKAAKKDEEPPPPATIAVSPEWLTKAKADKTPPAFAKNVQGPRTKEGHVLDEVQTAKVVTAMKDGKASALLAQIDEWLDETSFRDFTWRLFDNWARDSGHLRDKWLFRNIGRTLDDAGAFRLATLIEGWIKQSRKPAAEVALELLETKASPAALLAIQGLAQRFHYKGGYNIAAQALARVAHSRGVSVEDLEDSLVPTLGLEASEDGTTRVFDYGPRSFRMRISNELRVEVLMEDGETVLHGLPPPRKTDDAQKVDAAKRAFEQLRAELEKTLRVQSTRLEHALSSGRLWDSVAWEKHLYKHPVLKHIVNRLVWAGFEEDADAPSVTFIVDESGKLMNQSLDAVDQLPEGKIGLVHPAELDDETRKAWATALSDFEIIQPFNQLGRPVRGIPSSDADGEALTDFTKQPIAPGPLHGVLNRAGWIKSMPEEDLRIYHFHKRFETQNVTGVIRLDPGLVVTGYGEEPQTATEAFFIREKGMGYEDPDRVPLTDVGSIAISEVLYDLETLANAGSSSERR